MRIGTQVFLWGAAVVALNFLQLVCGYRLGAFNVVTIIIAISAMITSVIIKE